jgi:hypothetical protein
LHWQIQQNGMTMKGEDSCD